MGRSSTARTGGISRVRFVMLDAELPDGDIGQITQAIQSAFGPKPNQTALRVITASAQTTSAENVTSADNPSEIIDELQVEESNGPPRPRASRKIRTPEVLDVDLKSEPSFASFTAAKNPSSIPDKYLVVAAWFSLHRETDTITANHVFTCFRAAGWSVSISDFGQPLRHLKGNDLMNGDGKGGYKINHLGLDKVDKMK